MTANSLRVTQHFRTFDRATRLHRLWAHLGSGIDMMRTLFDLDGKAMDAAAMREKVEVRDFREKVEVQDLRCIVRDLGYPSLAVGRFLLAAPFVRDR